MVRGLPPQSTAWQGGPAQTPALETRAPVHGCRKCRGKSNKSYVSPNSASCAMPRRNSGRSMNSSSGSSCTMCRTPTSFFDSENSSNCSGNSAEHRSTHPTTPWIQLVLLGKLQQPARLLQALPRLHGDRAIQSFASSSGFEIPGRKSRFNTVIESLIHPYVRSRCTSRNVDERRFAYWKMMLSRAPSGQQGRGRRSSRRSSLRLAEFAQV